MEKNKLSDTAKKLLTDSENQDDAKKYAMYSPAQLAYAGDAVYELLARSFVIGEHDTNVHKMHRMTVNLVKASSQAYVIRKLEQELTEEEKRMVKRGRNAKVTSSPKNADLIEYRYATGFEALFGYLYLNKDIDRVMYLFGRAVEILNEKDEENENNRR